MAVNNIGKLTDDAVTLPEISVEGTTPPLPPERPSDLGGGGDTTPATAETGTGVNSETPTVSHAGGHSFTQKLIEVTISLASGNFEGGSGNSVTLSNRRITARIVKAGGASMGGAQVVVYGMTLSQMNQLTQYGLAETAVGKNSITVSAGDKAGKLTKIFEGTILTAFMDGNAAPEVGFRVSAAAGLLEAVKPAEPESTAGKADVSTIMKKLAGKMGLTFEDKGVNVKVSNPYLSGSARQQAKTLAEAAGIEWIIDNGTLAIWPPGQARDGNAYLADNSGLVGYPTFNSKGVVVSCYFNPDLKYGATVTVKSIITPACGEWVIYRLEYDLASLMPRGPWFCTIEAARPGQVPVA